MPTYVIDQNMMRTAELAARIRDEADSNFVIPDVAFAEMSKHPNWELTMGGNLAVFQAAPERVAMSLRVEEMLDLESDTWTPISPNAMLPEAFRGFVQSLIREFSSKQIGPSRTALNQDFDAVRNEMLNDELAAIPNKERMGKVVDKWLDHLRDEVLAELRTNDPTEEFLLAFAQSNGYEFARSYLERLGLVGDAAEAFLSTKPLHLRFWFAHTLHSLRGATKGKGWHGIRADKELNNRLDLDYGLIATFFDGFLSRDKGAVLAYEGLKRMLSTPQSEAESLAAETIARVLNIDRTAFD